jgi:hypothetical protein
LALGTVNSVFKQAQIDRPSGKKGSK